MAGIDFVPTSYDTHPRQATNMDLISSMLYSFMINFQPTGWRKGVKIRDCAFSPFFSHNEILDICRTCWILVHNNQEKELPHKAFQPYFELDNKFFLQEAAIVFFTQYLPKHLKDHPEEPIDEHLREKFIYGRIFELELSIEEEKALKALRGTLDMAKFSADTFFQYIAMLEVATNLLKKNFCEGMWEDEKYSKQFAEIQEVLGNRDKMKQALNKF